jgi:Holliday junction resolvasome RuvABC endonuclease subunit
MILGIDPGFRHCGISIVEWGSLARTVRGFECIDTDESSPGDVCFAAIVGRIDWWLDGWPIDTMAIEDMRGVRHGKNRERATSSNDDPVTGIMWAAMALAVMRGIPVRLVQPQSSTAAVGARKLVRLPLESEYKFKARRKAETERAVRVLLKCQIEMPVDCFDAAAHAVAAKLGKGRAW